MRRTPIQGSNLESVGYDKETDTVELEMYGGALYLILWRPD
jgi:hypothetical protein